MVAMVMNRFIATSLTESNQTESSELPHHACIAIMLYSIYTGFYITIVETTYNSR